MHRRYGEISIPSMTLGYALKINAMRKAFLLILMCFFTIGVSAQSVRQLQNQKRNLKYRISEMKNECSEARRLSRELGKVQKQIDGKRKEVEQFSGTQRQNQSNMQSRQDLLKTVIPYAINFPLRFRYSPDNVSMAMNALDNFRKHYKTPGSEFKKYIPLLQNYGLYNDEFIKLLSYYKRQFPIDMAVMQNFKADLLNDVYRNTRYGNEIFSSKRNKESIPYLDDIIYEIEVRTNITPDFLQSLIDKLQPK